MTGRADLLHPKSKLPHDDHDDHIGSGASTPPNGTATPRPDFSDKRLPGLINSYFAQVRDTSSMSECTSITPSPQIKVEESQCMRPTSSCTNEEHTAPIAEMAALDAPPPSSLNVEAESPRDLSVSDVEGRTEGGDYLSPLLPHEKFDVEPRVDSAYPTPPLSNSSSFHAQSGEPPRSSGEIAAISAARKRSWTGRRRSTPSLAALDLTTVPAACGSVVSKPEVAVHLSNPSTTDASPQTPTAAGSPYNLAAISLSALQIDRSRELTKAAQNTPPQTPRSGSHESRRGGGEDLNGLKLSDRSHLGSTNAATIGQARGQLEVRVEEARGLRPAVDPYVVCIFQLNEDISGGPKEDRMDTTTNDHTLDPVENLAKGVAMRRMGSGQGTPMAIPGLRSRQTSSTNIAELRRGSAKTSNQETTSPVWHHTATFDVVGENNEIDISVYDRAHNERFIGHVRLPLSLEDYEHQHEDWYQLKEREDQQDLVTGEIHLKIAFHATGKRIFGPDDFEILKLIGKGTFGQVFQVRKKDNQRIYAMKVLSKKVIVQKKEIQHTIGERNILVRTATTESPFIVGLKFSFQTAADLYLVTDYMSGGELFWHLQKEGRFHEPRAKFYIAELILALRHLHQHDIVYRDLKPENILLDANGHIALCDFGLSKANLSKNDTTNTFCGTTEYLAPEVLLDEQGYTKMVDFWSLGVLVFEMCCGWSPFYAEDTQQMYKNIAFGKVRFPRDALSQEGRNFVKGLLNRNPAHRLGAKGDAEELMAHPFFHDVDWEALSKKLVTPPFKPKLKGELDVSNFDPEFTNALASGNASSLNARAAALASGVGQDSTPLSPTMQNQFKGFTFVDESTLDQHFGGRDRSMDDGEDFHNNGFSDRPGDRMSGIESQSTTDDFNHGILEDI